MGGNLPHFLGELINFLDVLLIRQVYDPYKWQASQSDQIQL